MESTSVHLDDAVAVVAAVEEQVSYLRIALAAPPDEGWLSAAGLVADREALVASIAATQAGRGAPDLTVAASLWFQAYAFRVALPVVAPFALGLPGLSGDTAATWVRIARHRPAAVAVTDPALVRRSASQAADDLLGRHLSPVVEAVAGSVTVGRRLLWGNAAASIATVLRALDGAPGADRSAVRERGATLLVEAEPWLAGLGSFDLVSLDGGDEWRWTRTNCCLYDRCEGAARCDDCSLTSSVHEVAS
ncbi:MAG: IucA/IucC family C-terminal-domain containing protein [Aquihabitans sp.]